ncbi:MAG TPA: hypothetical protein VIF83_06530 [Gemmatimonadaceae bacterium]
MTLTYVVAVSEALAAYAVLALAFLGWGEGAARLFRAHSDVAERGSVTVWLGWAAALLVLQVVHLFLPLNSIVVAPVFAAGIIMAVPRLRRLVAERRVRGSRAPIVGLVCLLIAAIWIASRSMLPPENFDSGLYHIPTIRWINSYAIVPGLGNLHGRFAFNQSFFTYAAAVNAFPFQGFGRGIANSFLVLLLLWQSIELLAHWRNEAAGTVGNLTIQAAALVMLSIVVYLSVTSDGLASPTPDLAATLIQLSMFLIFIQCVTAWRSSEAKDHGVTVLAFLAATAITVKLSTLAFSACVLAVWLIESRRSYRGARGYADRAARLAPFALILGVWVIRGYVLSGCPVYPSTSGCVSVSWAVPLDKVADEARWIFGWARTPGVNWRQVLGSWSWLGPWLSRASHDIVGIVYPLVSSAILIIGAFLARKLQRNRTKDSASLSWIVLVPVLAGMTFWFFTAPDPRFGRVFFWLLALGAALLFVSSIQGAADQRMRGMALWAAVLVADASFIGFVLSKPSGLTAVSSRGWMPVETPRVTVRRTLSGLTVYTPGDDDRCWNAPLPCTPYFTPELRLLGSGLGSGFTVRHDPTSRIRYGQ